MTPIQELYIIGLLERILITLEKMKSQEREYWETWKISKMSEKSK